MRSLITKGVLIILGLLIAGLVSYPGSTVIANAGPLLNITGTPAEPPPPTAVPPANTAVPGATAAPQPSSVPNDKPDKHKDSHDGKPDVKIVKTVDQKSVAPGDLIGFSLHVTNEGDKTAENVVVNDTLTSYLDLVDYSTTKGSASVSGRTVTAHIDTLSPGEYVVVRIRARVNATASDTGSNTGTASDSNGDSNPNNNSSTVTFIIIQPILTPTPAPVMTEVPQIVVSTSAPSPVVKAPVAARAPRPAKLPVTGEDSASSGALGLMFPLVMIGLGGILLGLYMRRRVKS